MEIFSKCPVKINTLLKNAVTFQYSPAQMHLNLQTFYFISIISVLGGGKGGMPPPLIFCQKAIGHFKNPEYATFWLCFRKIFAPVGECPGALRPPHKSNVFPSMKLTLLM